MFDTDVQLRRSIQALVALPWPLKAWIAERPGAWRVYSGACRRLGWDRTALGWHTAPNGPFAGVRVEALHTNHIWAAMGLYEPGVARQLVALLHDPRFDGEVWDVGAHRALMSLLAVRHGAPRVLAIEPSLANIEMIERELTANPVLASRIDVMHAAVSDSDGDVEFVVNVEDGAICQIASPAVRQYERTAATKVVRARSRTVDSIAAQRGGRVGILKIDVEGAEVLVLAGAAEVLRIHRPAVVLEIHSTQTARDSLELLVGAGYTCRHLGTGGRLVDVAGVLSYGHVVAHPNL